VVSANAFSGGPASRRTSYRAAMARRRGSRRRRHGGTTPSSPESGRSHVALPPPGTPGRVGAGVRAGCSVSTQPPPQPSPGVPEEGTRRARLLHAITLVFAGPSNLGGTPNVTISGDFPQRRCRPHALLRHRFVNRSGGLVDGRRRGMARRAARGTSNPHVALV
jgi:hypothetical protein